MTEERRALGPARESISRLADALRAVTCVPACVTLPQPWTRGVWAVNGDGTVELIEIGRIVRLQIQRSSLKQGAGRDTYFDPAPIVSVSELELTTDGATSGGQVDVHNARHPQTKNRNGINPLALGFTSHYAAMRRRLGAHLTDGISGENILVETGRVLSPADVADGFVIETSNGQRVSLGTISVAHPCVEFSRFAMDDRRASPQAVSETLKFLDDGLRGFYARLDDAEPAPVRITIGDRVLTVVGH